MTDTYILDANGEPEKTEDYQLWTEWMEAIDARSAGYWEDGDLSISTIFIGVDHNIGGGEPTLWETMVTGGPWQQEIIRCGGNRERAIKMHEAVVARFTTNAIPAPTD